MGRIESYLGFAVRSGKIVYGMDNIETSRRRLYALVLGPDASVNLAERAERYAARRTVPLIKAEKPLEELIRKPNCKLVALLDANMAKAVISSVGR